MNMIFIRFWSGAAFVLFLATWTGLPLHAQQDNISEAPSGPLLKKAKAPMQWTVHFSYPQDAPPGKSPQTTQPEANPGDSYIKNFPRRIIVTLANNLVREQRVDISGAMTEQWQVGSTLYSKLEDGAWSYDQPGSLGSPNSGYSPIPASGYRDMEWISPSTYAGSTEFEGSKCLVFIADGKTKLAEKPAAVKLQLETAPLIVYVSDKTRYPVYHRIGGEGRRYEFNPSSPTSLALPADLAKAIKQGEEQRALLFQPAPRAY